MCGRFYIQTLAEDIAAIFDATFSETVASKPTFNAAPTQDITIVRAGEGGAPELKTAQWGLIPFWAKDRSIQNKLINARSETAASKPAFREAFAKRRCIVPADGFYEWMPPKAPPSKGSRGRKQPVAIYNVDANGEPEPLAMAGLWETWKDHDQRPIETCTILTTEANELLKPIHDRMPVILPLSEATDWLLGPNAEQEPAALQDMCRPYPPDRMAYHEVSPRVSNVRNNDPSLIEPVQDSDDHVPDTLFG